MKRNLEGLTKWFCSKLSYNQLSSVVPILQEVLTGKRTDFKLKPEEKKSPHYRDYRVDTDLPLMEDPDPQELELTGAWQDLLKAYDKKHGKPLKPRKSRSGKEPPAGCRCAHCKAPRKYLYINNGKLASQVRCKICGKTSPTHGVRRESVAKYWCPHCHRPLYKWKDSSHCIIFKCPNHKCSHFLKNSERLTDDETAMRVLQKYDPSFKLHYQYREYHLDPEILKVARPEVSPTVSLKKIHNNFHVVGLVLTFTVNFGLSSRITARALKGLFKIDISHQTVVNYANAAACHIAEYVDKYSPKPSSTAAADETYIIVEKEWHYTWFIIDSKTRALCGHNLSTSRSAESALALLYDCYGPPEEASGESAELVTDGLPSYDNAVMTYNAHSPEAKDALTKKTVIGLKNHDPESTEYRAFKQLIERLNRTYKYHTRPRAGFKSFDGAVALTTLFVAYYNFMRPHQALKDKVPVKLDCIKESMLMPDAWVTLLKEAA